MLTIACFWTQLGKSINSLVQYTLSANYAKPVIFSKASIIIPHLNQPLACCFQSADDADYAVKLQACEKT